MLTERKMRKKGAYMHCSKSAISANSRICANCVIKALRATFDYLSFQSVELMWLGQMSCQMWSAMSLEIGLPIQIGSHDCNFSIGIGARVGQPGIPNRPEKLGEF